MYLGRSTLILLAAAALAACGPGPAQQPTAATGAPGAPTAAATQAPASGAPTAAPSQAPAPTAAPTGVPTAQPSPTALPKPTATAIPPTQPSPATQPPAASGDELLFLRKGALVAFDVRSRKERQIADRVVDFVPSPDRQTIALVRDTGKAEVDLWLVRRDGSGLKQLTRDSSGLIEATPAWSPDGAALAYAASASSDLYARTWPEWSSWCDASEVHVLDITAGADQSFGPGCDPAISPDGKRIAYATPPSARAEGENEHNAANAIRLINRQGKNGWSFAAADGSANGYTGKAGMLVYAPAWSPDGKQIVYHRFVGYRALVDIGLSEIGGSLEGRGQPLSGGAGWLLPAQFAPDGRALAIVENNYSDARGFGGYDNWKVAVLRLEGSHQVVLPEATLDAVGQVAGELPRAQAAAWSPDGGALAVLLPPGWSAGLSPNEPTDAGEKPGEIWRWRPGAQPGEKLVAGVDFGSPLAWLPAA